MEIYLVQHGEAKSEADDPERPPGSILRLVRTEDGWRIAWYLTPDLAGLIAG